MIVWLLSPIGRKISLTVGLVLALLYGYRIVTNRAFESGKAEGQKAALSYVESQQKAEWALVQKQIDEQLKGVSEQIVALKDERAAFETRRKTLTTTVVRTTTNYDTQKSEIIKQVADLNAEGVAAIAARVDDIIQKMGDPRQALIALETNPILVRENDDLKTLIASLQENADEDRTLSTAELNAAHDQTAIAQSQLSQAGRERDFYRDAYKALSKKPHGFWHKLGSILTLGIMR